MAQTTTVKIRRSGDRSYPAHSAITAGQVVEAIVSSGADVAQPSSADSTTVVGVAMTSATNDDTSTGSALNVFPLPISVTVLAHGECYVTYAADCNVGQALKAAADGQVTPWVSGTDDADLIIGYCTATTTTGNIGPAYIGRG